MSDPLISIDQLSVSYGGKPVLSGIDMTVRRGQFVAIMGGSGCGKTTLLRTIGGQLKPGAGSVSVDGQVVNRLSHAGLYALRRKMGMLFQFGALFTDLSVFDNVAFPLREHAGLPEPIVRDLVLMKLQAVGLRGAQNKMPQELSGGMARRVALARAVALDPMLILYDEPFTGLDPISLSIIARLIQRLGKALGTTSIMVTHDVEASLNIVDYVYFIAEGKIAAEGTPAEIRASDAPLVRQFVHAEADGPVAFHAPAAEWQSELGLAGQRSAA
ncbi:MAG: ABC transporter ATP-binding protein [Zoogloeaceae bacterium]|jgi:phospholipid/cholesterol/gamma-HCH transport system ATP-binding protein|nr:ABC transporter ATP-binding protein [Zoogloeaceae bacterium]